VALWLTPILSFTGLVHSARGVEPVLNPELTRDRGGVGGAQEQAARDADADGGRDHRSQGADRPSQDSAADGGGQAARAAPEGRE